MIFLEVIEEKTHENQKYIDTINKIMYTLLKLHVSLS